MGGMRCVRCKACLSYEAVVASQGDGVPRPDCRWEVKGVDWLWRTGDYRDTSEVVLCSTACLAEWMSGAKVAATNTLEPYRAAQMEPRERVVSMTTADYTTQEIDQIYAEIMIGGLPKNMPEKAMKNIAEGHGAVRKVSVNGTTGCAYVLFESGESGESFFMSCNGALLPPSAESKHPVRLDVEFLQFLPQANPYLYDDMFGAKCTRQLLRAMPRPPTPRHPYEREGGLDRVFSMWEAHLRDTVHPTQDHRALVAGNITDTSVVIARNWMLFRYNFDDPLARATRLLRAHRGDLMASLRAVEHTHINGVVGDTLREKVSRKLEAQEAKRKKAGGEAVPVSGEAPSGKPVAWTEWSVWLRMAVGWCTSSFSRAEDALFNAWLRGVMLLPLLCSVHAVAIAVMSVTVVFLAARLFD